ncbi:nucleotide sugar dehydrogenase [bacterium]|nr:nucleotide sugar dehydrogenase [bacterium]
MPTLDNLKIAVVGLGYVGLPLAVEFGKRYAVIGFDINAKRVDEINAGQDRTRELATVELQAAKHLTCSSDPKDLAACNVYIVTVPTPIDGYKRPDLRPLLAASVTVGKALSEGDVAIYESTVYPGCTEEDCVPILEQQSGLRFNEGFTVGYSPERINPGDKQHRLPDIRKVTSGSTPDAADFVDALYAKIITAGTHKASSLKVAEAAKVIENTQRDINIALVNELAVIFDKLGIDTLDVLEAAGTKWNFLPFRPGLVGGHCIGVDPYYLTHKAQAIGHHAEMILSGRRINDAMGQVVADRVVKLMLKRKLPMAGAKVLILGLTFKENCPDLRNTRVVDIAVALQQYHLEVDVHDPWLDAEEAADEYGLTCLPGMPDGAGTYSAIITAVAHEQFTRLNARTLRRVGVSDAVLFDVKNVLPKADVDGRL